MSELVVGDDICVKWFLVAFDREAGETHVDTFDDQSEAFRRYIDAERDPRVRGRRPIVDLVLIGSDSVESVRRAYPHYFQQGTRRERLLAVEERFNRMLAFG